MANEPDFQLLLFAYNLMDGFRRLSRPPEFQTAILQTFRHQVLVKPALVRRTNNRLYLHLYRALPASGNRGTARQRFTPGRAIKLRRAALFTQDSGSNVLRLWLSRSLTDCWNALRHHRSRHPQRGQTWDLERAHGVGAGPETEGNSSARSLP